MAIYQAPRRRWRLAVITGVIGALVGFGIGALVMHKAPSPTVALTQLDRELDDVAGLIGVVEVEYNDARSGTATELKGARDALDRAHQRWVQLRDAVRVIGQSDEAGIEAGFAGLDHAMATRRSVSTVTAKARSLARMIQSVVGG